MSQTVDPFPPELPYANPGDTSYSPVSGDPYGLPPPNGSPGIPPRPEIPPTTKSSYSAPPVPTGHLQPAHRSTGPGAGGGTMIKVGVILVVLMVAGYFLLQPGGDGKGAGGRAGRRGGGSQISPFISAPSGASTWLPSSS